MAKNIKHLIKIYSEYKKIKGMADGGRADYNDSGRRSQIMTQRDQEDQDLANEIGSEKDEQSKESLYKLKDKNQKDSKEMLGYSDGEEVQPDMKPTKKGVNSGLHFPIFTPKPETLDEKYARIRKENSERNTGKRSDLESDDPDYNSQTMYKNQGGLAGYAEGTDPEPVSEDDGKNWSEDLYPPSDMKDPEEDSDISDEPSEGDESEKDLENEAKTGGEDEPDSYVEEEGAARRAERDVPDVPSEDKNATLQRLLTSQDDSEFKEPSKTDFTQSSLKSAQDARDENYRTNAILRGAALIGGGISRTDPSLALKNLNEDQKTAGLPIEGYKEQVANQENDPNSPVSSITRDYLKQKYKINIPDNASYANIKGVAGFALKDQALQLAIQRSILSSNTKLVTNKNSVDSANKRAEDKLKVEKQKADAATETAKGNKELKTQAGYDRTLNQTKTALETARGNPAAAQAEKDLYSVDKADSIFKIYPNLNDIPDAQVNLAIGEIAKIAQGGVPTGHEIEALKPNTPESKLQKLWGQATNKPTGANLGAYLKELKKYNEALRGDAKKVIQDKYGRIIESSKGQLGDQNYKSLQDNYLNRFSKEKESKSHPQDADALAWAQQNPTDPRAAKILQINGMGQ